MLWDGFNQAFFPPFIIISIIFLVEWSFAVERWIDLVCVCVWVEREKREVQLGLISLVPVHFFHPLLERIFISGTCFYVARAPLNEREKLSLSTTSCRIPCFVSTKGEGLDIDSFFFLSLRVSREESSL